jgi:general stress protein 26
LKQDIIQQLEKSKLGVLATAEGSFVTARQVMLICDGLKVSFFTSTHTRKYRQIKENQNVAIAIGNIQIEGLASIKGPTSEKENAWFLKAFEKTAPKVYKSYRDECLDPQTTHQLIEVTPKRIAVFSMARELDVLNIPERTATRYSGKDGFPPGY